MPTPAHDIRSTFIGTGELSYCLGATTPAQASSMGYRDIGNITAFRFTSNSDEKKHWGAYRGSLIKDRTLRRKIELGYKITSDEFRPENIALLLYGQTAGVLTRTALAAATGSVLPFTATPANLQRWYDIRDSAGNRVYNFTTVTITSKVEGTDFELDPALGRIRFLTAQAADLTPTITAPAIVAGDVNSATIITPLTRGQEEGIFRLSIFDEDTLQRRVFEHVDFGGSLTVDGETELKSDDFNSFGLMLAVGSPAGRIFAR